MSTPHTDDEELELVEEPELVLVLDAELELEVDSVTKLNEVKTDPMGPVADVLIVAAELADKNLLSVRQFRNARER